jgi:hypothetical protein
MPTNTYVALATQTLGSNAASVTFSSISQAYTDLFIVYNTGVVSTTNDYVRLNGDTGSNYSWTRMVGTGSAASSSRGSNDSKMIVGDVTTTIVTTQIVNIQNYSNTTTFKTILNRSSAPNSAVTASVGLWRNTAAVTSVTLLPDGTSWLAGSTFTIYGISNAGDATPKATGGDVTSDATYWYHTFTMSGNFVPNQTLSCDYLIVGGGGGAANNGGGGGGAGGYRTATASSFTAGTYQVLVGAGGAGRNVASQGAGTSGTLSAIGSTQSAGGGFGHVSSTGGSGGSGGAGSPAGAGNTPSTSPSQGNNGGGVVSNCFGGGGGASAVGQDGSALVAGAGGAGSFTAISGGATTGYGQLVSGNYYFAGGGGGGGNNDFGVTKPGGAGGNGGGGAGGATNAAGANALVNSGGGGGGAGNVNPTWFAAGNGGSGIVIVRYLKA